MRARQCPALQHLDHLPPGADPCTNAFIGSTEPVEVYATLTPGTDAKWLKRKQLATPSQARGWVKCAHLARQELVIERLELIHRT